MITAANMKQGWGINKNIKKENKEKRWEENSFTQNAKPLKG